MTVTAKIGVYAGSFDPMTYGHLSVIEKANGIFDYVIVLIATNPAKTPTLSREARVYLARETLDRFASTASSSGNVLIYDLEPGRLVVNFAFAVKAHALIRGIRTGFDADEELKLAYANDLLACEIPTVFFPADPELSMVSSSMLKVLLQHDADTVELCSTHTKEFLLSALGHADDLSKATEKRIYQRYLTERIRVHKRFSAIAS